MNFAVREVVSGALAAAVLKSLREAKRNMNDCLFLQNKMGRSSRYAREEPTATDSHDIPIPLAMWVRSFKFSM